MTWLPGWWQRNVRLVVAGDAVGREGGVGALVRVVEALGAAVYHQPMNDRIDVPTDHPQYCGMLAPTATDIRATLADHDVVLLVGCHAFMAHHYTPGPFVPEDTEVVQIDSDAAEIGRNVPVAVGLVGGIRVTLEALETALHGRIADAGERAARLAQTTQDLRDKIDRRVAAQAPATAPLRPLTAVHAIARALPDDAVVVEEAITAGLDLRRVLRQRRPGSYMHTVGGALGWGTGAAIGARMGDPARPVVAVLGDGCAAFGLQGLWSAVRHEVPVVFTVMNNGEYRTLKQTMDTQGRPDTYVGLDLQPRLDWLAAGRLFGMPAVRVTTADELSDIICGSGTRDGPLLVDVPITGHEADG